MAKQEDRRSRGDKSAERRGVPGRDKQTPAETTGIYMGDKHIADVTSNFRGLMGGTPTDDARSLRKMAEFNRGTGATDSAKAAETRARNVEGHESATSRSRQAIKGEVLRAKASAPDASTYDKLRYSVFKTTGMKKGGKVKAQPVKKMAKGGSTASKRGDGCATKGKTKGRFV